MFLLRWENHASEVAECVHLYHRGVEEHFKPTVHEVIIALSPWTSRPFLFWLPYSFSYALRSYQPQILLLLTLKRNFHLQYWWKCWTATDLKWIPAEIQCKHLIFPQYPRNSETCQCILNSITFCFMVSVANFLRIRIACGGKTLMATLQYLEA